MFMNITVIKVIQFIFENYWAFSNRKWKNNIFTKNLISIKNRKIGKFFNSISLDAFQFVKLPLELIKLILASIKPHCASIKPSQT